MRVICAWCGCEMQAGCEPTSHGICASCAERTRGEHDAWWRAGTKVETRPCELRHQEHGVIALDPNHPQQVRQGDVLLNPIGTGAWEVIRQNEYDAQRVRQVAD